MNDLKRLIIKQFQIKGFRSISDLSVNFEEGLTIVIGKNASGKSNFIEALNRTLLGTSRAVPSYRYSKLLFHTENNLQFIWENERVISQDEKLEDENLKTRLKFREKLYLNNKLAYDSEDPKPVVIENKSYVVNLTVRNLFRHASFRSVIPVYIRFKVPEKLEAVSEPYSLKIDLTDEGFGLFDIQSLRFISNLIFSVEVNYDIAKTKKNYSKSTVLNKLKIDSKLKLQLKKYTPIRDVRFSENINIFKNDKSVVIENLKIEFQIGKYWLPYSQLSDGTKRLFYLIAEITSANTNLVLIDEPELGIHPHQFNQLMDFLKEEAENKQIIVTTHSPLALNHLKDNELSHILITKYDTKKGTQIRTLTTREKTKALKYIKEFGFFSDYWMLSDLES